MAEYIERERLKAAINEDAMNCLQSWDSSFASLVMIEIDEIPAADVAPVVHGRWMKRDGYTECSECEYWYDSAESEDAGDRPNYCPSCGAKMQEAR